MFNLKLICGGDWRVLETNKFATTVCPRSSDPFYDVTYHIKLVTTSWTHSINIGKTNGCPDCLLPWRIRALETITSKLHFICFIITNFARNWNIIEQFKSNNVKYSNQSKTVCPRSLVHFYIVIKIGQDIMDRLYMVGRQMIFAHVVK